MLDIQSRLRRLGYDLGTDGVDGYFGEDTRKAVLEFQQYSGLVADGIVAENTWCELVEARNEPGERLLYLRIPPFRGADVLFLQRSLNCLGFNAGPEDGILGTQTERAILDFQKNAGLVMDGMVDESVLKVMARVTKDGELHSSESKIPDRNGGYAGGKSLQQLTVAIDPGHGGRDPGAASCPESAEPDSKKGKGRTGVSGKAASVLAEKDLNLTVSRHLAGILEAAGCRVVLTRSEDVEVPLYDRPVIANMAGADLFLSIHHNANGSPCAQGASGYYFCRQGYYSETGRMIAGHIVASLAKDLKIPDIPVLGRNYAVLRETEMPAVMIEPFFLTSGDLKKMGDIGDLAKREAEALFKGLKEYFAIR